MKKDASDYSEFIREILSLLFSYSLIFYLILYLFETIIPGFVTDNFSLNWILIPTLFFGVLSSIFPANKKRKKVDETGKAAVLDLVFTIILSLGTFFLIFFKLKIDTLILRWTVSLISSLLTLSLGLMLLYFPDDSKNEDRIEKQSLNKFSFNYKKLFISHFQIPIPVALVILVVLVVFIPQNTTKIVKNIDKPSDNTSISIITTPTPTAQITVALPTADPKLKIIISSAGAEDGDAKRISSLYKQAGYQKVEIVSSDKNIDNALIEFNDTNSSQADLVEDILKGEYLTVDRSPLATSSAEIKIFLGAQPQPIDGDPNSRNENFDFFFN